MIRFLNLGSFVDTVNAEEWCNIDILPLADRLPGINFMQHDLRQGIPWPDGSITVIRASHILEHITLEEARALCCEMYRVLAYGGIVRIAVPDAQLILPRYIACQMDCFNDIQPVEYQLANTQCEKLSRILFSGDYAHKALYDYWMLRDFLSQAGFSMIAQRRPDESSDLVIGKDTKDQHVEESLYVEAVK